MLQRHLPVSLLRKLNTVEWDKWYSGRRPLPESATPWWRCRSTMGAQQQLGRGLKLGDSRTGLEATPIQSKQLELKLITIRVWWFTPIQQLVVSEKEIDVFTPIDQFITLYKYNGYGGLQIRA
ncbi:Uncharacterized protein Fot_38865 [Forsythia ovata]|uniref:Uncharacterized protein n=1 Tax=Forsythia ovata TaxID=205694 RepID=A0ABD1S2Z4_9LAMI